MTIRNTSNDPAGMLALAMLLGPSGAIEHMEKEGQQQLVHSDQLPTDTDSTDGAFLALGFTFDEPQTADALFRPATLPDGWRKEASEHDMWSYLVDEHGRRRVAVFYKAAPYDRRANMRLLNVYEYLGACQYYGRPVVADDTWATSRAIVAAAKKHIAAHEDTIALYSRADVVKRDPKYAAERVAETKTELSYFAEVAARFDTAAREQSSGGAQ